MNFDCFRCTVGLMRQYAWSLSWLSYHVQTGWPTLADCLSVFENLNRNKPLREEVEKESES